MVDSSKDFYDREYQAGRYVLTKIPEVHSFYPVLKLFIEEYGLRDKRCLEIGCGIGAFQDIVEHYVGIDISSTVGQYVHKPFVTASAAQLPFQENSFDAIWSYAVLEHVLEPDQALNEMRRVLKPGGMLVLAPAWQCRPWAAEGYPVRPYHDFNWWGKLIKASIPIRDSLWFRVIYILPRRFTHLLHYFVTRQAVPFWYKCLKPNYEKLWMSDSDAVNSMDPFDTILWFVSRNDICINYSNLLSAIFVRTGKIILRKK